MFVEYFYMARNETEAEFIVQALKKKWPNITRERSHIGFADDPSQPSLPSATQMQFKKECKLMIAGVIASLDLLTVILPKGNT